MTAWPYEVAARRAEFHEQRDGLHLQSWIQDYIAHLETELDRLYAQADPPVEPEYTWRIVTESGETITVTQEPVTGFRVESITQTETT